MTTRKDVYWIADAGGVKGFVVGADDRDLWTRVKGWSLADEPSGLEFQWVRNLDHGGKGVLNHEAALLHRGLGWVPCGPEGYDEPADDEPVKSPAAKAGNEPKGK